MTTALVTPTNIDSVLSLQITQLKKAHLRLMRHPETCLYSGIILMGKSEVEDEPYTAYTDGKNKRYSSQFLATLNLEEVTALVLHENLHVALMHLVRHKAMMKEDRQLANAAMDYVVNDIIMSLVDKTLCKLPKGGCYDPKFHNWSVREVWDYLRTGQHGKTPPPGQSQGQGKGDTPAQGKPERSENEVTIGGESYSIGGMDEHDEQGEAGLGDMTEEQVKEFAESVDEAVRQGGMLAGRFGAKVPRIISEMLTPKVDWRKETAEFVTSVTKGQDEYSWRRFNRRHLASDYYLPTTENEKLGEWVVALDTSGSISTEDITEFATELQALCNLCSPERVRVLWWDTAVHGEQVFEGDYSELHKMLKPLGGGGTRVGCVSEYMVKESIKADCMIVMTDGYVEDKPVWDTTIPSLWLVTLNRSFTPPSGRKVFMEKD
jgi:predicted metal-dependent peptidase